MLITTQTWMDAQQAVLGACLIDGRAASQIVFNLEETDFIESYRALFTAIRELYLTGKAVDPITVLDVVGQSYRDFIVELMNVTPTAANIDRYVEITKRQGQVLRMREIGMQLAEVDDAATGSEIAAQAVKMVARNESDTWSLGKCLGDFMNRYQRKPEYLDWFIQELRGKLRVEPGDFYLLGARPSAGKTAFALQAALYWSVICGKRVGFFSHETSIQKMTDRLIAAGAGVPLKAIKERTLSDKELEAVCTMAGRINEAPLDLISAPGKTVQEMAAATLYKRYEIIIIDYLQIVAGPGQSEYERLSMISQNLHTMCQSIGVFCLGLCQLSRTKGAEPTLEDLRGTGQLEQDADAVMFLHKLENEPDNPRALIIAKNKDGETGTTKLAFRGDCQQFRYQGNAEQPKKAFDYTKPIHPQRDYPLLTEPDDQLPFTQ